MYLYVLFFVISICAFFDIFYQQEQRGAKYKTVYIAIILTLFTLSAFRLERGSDWNSYKWYFEATSWDVVGTMEWGFDLLNRFLSLFTSEYSVLIFFIAFIIFALKAPLTYKLSQYPFISLLVWFAIYFSDIFPNRQFIATAFLLVSMIYVQQKKLLPFLLLVFAASLFHISALIFVITYWIYHIRLSKITLLIIFAGFYGLAIVLSDMLQHLLGIISNPIIQERLADYLESGTDVVFGDSFSAREVIIRGFVNRFMIVAASLFFLDKLRDQDDALRGWINLYLLGGILFAIFSTISFALTRISWYFDVSIIFILPYFFVLKSTKATKMIIYSIIVLYLLYRFVAIVNNYYDLYIPYKSFFWNSDLPVSIY